MEMLFLRILCICWNYFV